MDLVEGQPAFRKGGAEQGSRSLRGEDLVPRVWVFGIEPALELLPIAVVKDAHHPRPHVDTTTLRAHDAQRADMLIVAEDIMLDEPEALRPQPAEPCDEVVTAPYCSGHWVSTRDVPDNVDGNEGGECEGIVRPKRVGGSAIRERVWMLHPLGHSAYERAVKSSSMPNRRSATRLGSTRYAPCSYSLVIHASQFPRSATVSSAMVRSTYSSSQ